MRDNPYYKPYWLNDDELEHYGILGMKWGVRRYQNKDGTLTAAGKKRYAGDNPEDIKRSEDRKAKIMKVAKTGAIAAGVALASGATLYGLSKTTVGKAAVSAGVKAISKLVDSTSGGSSKRNDMEWVQPYKSSSSGSGQSSNQSTANDWYQPYRSYSPGTGLPSNQSTANDWYQPYRSSSSGSTTNEPVWYQAYRSIGNIPVSSIPNVSPEYLAEYEYNSKRNRF